MESKIENMESVLCKYNYTIFKGDDGWSINIYKYEGEIKTPNSFIATGTDLPNEKEVTFQLFGEWKLSKRNGQKEFNVVYFDIQKPTSKDEIIAYLQAMRCGFGKATANRVYTMFGENTWEIIENDPYQLSAVYKVSEKMVNKLLRKQTESMQLKNIFTMCRDAGISLSPTIVKNVIGGWKEKSAETIAENPFRLAEFNVPFEKMDALAKSFGFPEDFPPRMEAAVIAILNKAAVSGHVCLPKADVVKNGVTVTRGILTELKNFVQCDQEKCVKALNDLWSEGKLKSANGFIYTAERYNEEQAIADNIRRLNNFPTRPIEHILPFIDEYEQQNFKLADSQREAVEMVFRNQVNIITGGPGTGKTTVIKAVLYAHQMVFGESSEPILLAPTGKAARRMSDATGFPAQTIHSAVGYRDEQHQSNDDISLAGNLIIVDESSMMDQQIASILLSKVPDNAKIVFVGDVDQLPSVGCGNVLKDMIDSKAVATTRLTVIFRQSGDNPIITNSFRINIGNTDLVYTSTFRFVETNTINETFREACILYFKCVKAYGIDNVILLNPQRNGTELSVSAFNLKLQELMHKHKELLKLEDEGQYTMTVNGITFRKGDKVMQLKNTENARNGDTGFIRDIVKSAYQDDEETTKWAYNALIEFNDSGECLEYTMDDMKDVDLAYCSTVHKAQGEEYKTVIIIVSKAHPTMLKRKIIYTAVTRSKVNVALIGDQESLKNAILHGEEDPRYTLLQQRLRANT